MRLSHVLVVTSALLLILAARGDDAHADEPATPAPQVSTRPAAKADGSDAPNPSLTEPGPQPDPKADGSDVPIVALIIGGAGLVSIGFGVYFGLQVEVHQDRAASHCTVEIGERRCDTKGVRERDTAQIDEILALSLVGVGVGALLLGEVMFVSRGRTTVRAKSQVSPTALGVAVEARW